MVYNNTMPKITLKPNSPEYADSQHKIEIRSCEMPGCCETAEHKAPMHRGLNEFHHFCTEHVREYNKAWDFFSGMSNADVQDHMRKSRYGDRPTWKYGVNGSHEDFIRDKVNKEYNYSDNEPRHKKHGTRAENGGYALSQNSPEHEAMAIMGLAPPVTLGGIKKRYKDLAKKHHPDLNFGCKKSEELLKTINMSYTILKLAYAQFEKLPQRA